MFDKREDTICRENYIEDFSELERMLVLDMNFPPLRLQRIRRPRSVNMYHSDHVQYLPYISIPGDWTLQDVSNYVNTMVPIFESGSEPAVSLY